ncbi:MAG: hypothetical protein QMC22_03400 [Pseudomonadales bacterium]|jgi:hypothetical protein
MKLRFLCESHRGALTQKASLAINCWQNGFDTGQAFYDQKLWSDALPHLGCAFESAEIMMSTQAIDRDNAYQFFTYSAVLLADTFMQLAFIERGREVCLLSIERLEKELNFFPEMQDLIKSQLDILYQSIKQIDFLSLNFDNNSNQSLQHCASFADA